MALCDLICSGITIFWCWFVNIPSFPSQDCLQDWGDFWLSLGFVSKVWLLLILSFLGVISEVDLMFHSAISGVWFDTPRGYLRGLRFTIVLRGYPRGGKRCFCPPTLLVTGKQNFECPQIPLFIMFMQFNGMNMINITIHLKYDNIWCNAMQHDMTSWMLETFMEFSYHDFHHKTFPWCFHWGWHQRFVSLIFLDANLITINWTAHIPTCF